MRAVFFYAAHSLPTYQLAHQLNSYNDTMFVLLHSLICIALDVNVSMNIGAARFVQILIEVC